MALPTLTDQAAAVVAAIEGAGVLVGDGDKPSGAGWQGEPGQSSFVAYVIFADNEGGRWTGTINDPYVDVETVFRVQCVGANAHHARHIAATVRDAVLSLRDDVVDGFKADNVDLRTGSGTMFPDRSTDPPLFVVSLPFDITWTPA